MSSYGAKAYIINTVLSDGTPTLYGLSQALILGGVIKPFELVKKASSIFIDGGKSLLQKRINSLN